jgi:hypothetical protein
VTEARVAPVSPAIGLEVGRFAVGQGIVVHGVVRGGRHLFGRLEEAALQAGAILLLEADTATLERTIDENGLELVERGKWERRADGPELSLMEAVVLPDAVVQGSSPAPWTCAAAMASTWSRRGAGAAGSKAACATRP